MGYTQLPGSRVIYAPEEYAWARCRPFLNRTPIPQPGDEVYYRHVEMGPVVRADVLEVQSLEDFSDPNLWYFQTDQFNQPRFEEDAMILAQAHDPWPEVTLKVLFGTYTTREARLRGSPGWLPLDWEFRFRPEPKIVIQRN